MLRRCRLMHLSVFRIPFRKFEPVFILPTSVGGFAAMLSAFCDIQTCGSPPVKTVEAERQTLLMADFNKMHFGSAFSYSVTHCCSFQSQRNWKCNCYYRIGWRHVLAPSWSLWTTVVAHLRRRQGSLQGWGGDTVVTGQRPQSGPGP